MALPLTLSTRLADHRGAYVELRCGVCGHRRDVYVDALARIIGWDVPLASRLEHFRFSGFGAHRGEDRLRSERKPHGGGTKP